MADAGNKPSADLPTLLSEGIAAAKAGDRQGARDLLARVVQMDDRNVTAWLWLSGVVDDLNYREVCLQTALKLDPGNAAARRGLTQVRQQKVDELLRAGIAAAERGQRDHARGLLMRVVEQDEKNLTAWLWLSGLVTSLEDREVSLENVLALDPSNEAVRRTLEQVREQKELEAATRAEMAPHIAEAPEREGPAPSPASVQVDWSQPTPSDEFDNPLLCPYCAKENAYEAKRCAGCGADLVLKVRRREERSTWLWVAITLQLSNLSWYLVGFVVVLIAAGVQSGVEGVGRLLSVYLGLPNDVPPEAAATLLAAVPRYVLLVLAVAFLAGLFNLAGLYLRWRPIFYLYLANAILQLLAAAAGLALLRGSTVVCGVLGVLMAFGMVTLAFQMQDDFFFNYSRLLLEPDREARSGTDHLAHGRRYAQQGMWAMAVVHLQRATGLLSGQVEVLLTLALAYLKLQRYERAAAVLAEARRIDPQNPGVADLEAMLQQAPGSNPAPTGARAG